jgi:DNA polymerase-3 subunit delta
MPKGASRTVDALLERESPDAVYLLHGDNEFLKDEAVRAIADRFTDAATRAFNLDILHAGDADPGRLSNALDALPMLAARRVVVLRDAPGLKKDARAVLDRYLAKPASDTLLILVAPAGWKAEAGLTSKATVIEMASPSERDAAAWAIGRATELGANLETDAAELLVRSTEADLALIDGELRKLRDYSPGRAIDRAAVAAIVGTTSGATMEDVLDRVCARDGVGAAGMIETALAQPKASGVTLVLALTTHMLMLGHGVIAREGRMSPGLLSKELFALMGESRSSFVGRPWGTAVSAVVRTVDQWDRDSVDRALALLREADSTLKDSNLSGEERILETLVLSICAPRSSRHRAA